MAEYQAFLLRKYQLPVRQFVIYLGASEASMKTRLPEDQQITGYELRSLRDLDVKVMLDAETPGEIILSILGDYPRSDANAIIEQTITRLVKASRNETELRRAIQQLLILSRLRNLEVVTKEKIREMPITYDVTKDGLFKEGIQEGIRENKFRTVKNALKQGKLSVEEIADLAEISIEEVLTVQSQIINN